MQDAEKMQLLHRIQELEHELDINQIKYSILADCTDCGLWEYDIETKCLNQSKKLHGIWEQSNLVIPNYRETILGWGLVHPEDIKIFEAYCDSMDKGESGFQYDLRSITDYQKFAWLRYTGTTYFDENGKPKRVVGKTLDVTKEKQEIENLERKANLDPLTQLMNKTYTRIKVEKVLGENNMEKPQHGFFLVDIDNFKEVNDTWGHLYGDNLLSKVADTLLASMTAKDVVGRIGGDEFLIFVPNVKSEIEAKRIAEKIVIRGRNVFIDKHRRITVSVGFSMYPKDAQSYDGLFRSADLALYQAKGRGKDRYSAYDKNGKYEIVQQEKEKREEGNQIINRNMDNIETDLFDYSFETISTADDIGTAIQNIMMEVGIYYNLSRISIVEFSKNTKEAEIFKMWTKQQDEDLKEKLEEYYTKWWHFFEERYYSLKFYVHNSFEADEIRLYQPEEEEVGYVQFPIFDGEEMTGIITYVKEKEESSWRPNQVATLSCISKMVSSYLLKLRGKEKLEDELLYNSYAMDSQKLTYYVIDSQTYNLLYVSRYANELFPNICVGKKCYETVMNRKSPCVNCPIAGLNEQENHFATELYSKEYSAWFTTSVSVIQPESMKQYLLCWSDVTAFLDRVRSTDKLTGTLSYDKFYAEAVKNISQTNIKYAMMYLGIKDFARINDEFGFEVGDSVIRHLATRFQDAMSRNELICRIKGDDFIVMLEDKELLLIKERVYNICKSAEIFLHTLYPAMNIQCICGIYEITEEDYSFSAILDKANKARKKAYRMYSGDHTLFIYTKEDEKQEREEQQLERDMIEALKTEQFEVYIQPKVSLESRKIGGAEALVRWRKPDGTMVSPGRFIPLAEKNGMVIDIDNEVYNILFRQMKEWLDKGVNIPTVSLNVSRLHLLDDGFPDYFESLVDSYGIPHELVEVEITESVFFDKIDRMIDMISKIREKGFIISMDDFGTGYSTLNIMSNLPLDVIKIDGKFFMNTPLDERNRTIISAIVNLTKSLDFSIVCEGIETLEQVDYIANEQCDYAQGYYFYKPMPMQEFEKLL